MMPEEYKYRMEVLAAEFEAKKRALVKECALSNNQYNVGDIVTDHIGSVKVEKIMTTTSNDKPTCVYYGIELKKDMTPKKNDPRRQAWQNNLIKK